ncbi:hypothetical protein C8R41DRAFT_499229 [Lentinula lateritia]|uniref:Uncharacterized protein n=1 Tax=Lentinula lateritia TaxID=40482 RepID=A0ABQ8V8D3_9AGAR|nr:hypothetical protein C8R41DRAFT_499229 [Lentinula lateritia]
MITEETDLNKRLREAKGWEKIKQVRTWHLGGIGYHPISCPSRFKRGRVDSVVRYNEVESAKVVMARHKTLILEETPGYISGIVIWTSIHDLMALCHRSTLADIVFLSPTTIKAFLARVHATFSRRSSSTKPISARALDRTVENTMMSLSRPWNESMVDTGTRKILRKTFVCFVYGDRTVIVGRSSSERRLPVAPEVDRRLMMCLIRAA